MSENELLAFISRHRLGVLGTIGDRMTPQSSLVGFAVSPALEIVFDTVRTSRKYHNLLVRPDCSFALGWEGEQTVQYEGRAEELGGTNLQHFLEIYFKAWPEGREHMAWPGIVHFVLRPCWIRYSDFDRRPPLIQEFWL